MLKSRGLKPRLTAFRNPGRAKSHLRPKILARLLTAWLGSALAGLGLSGRAGTSLVQYEWSVPPKHYVKLLLFLLNHHLLVAAKSTFFLSVPPTLELEVPSHCISKIFCSLPPVVLTPSQTFFPTNNRPLVSYLLQCYPIVDT